MMKCVDQLINDIDENPNDYFTHTDKLGHILQNRKSDKVKLENLGNGCRYFWVASICDLYINHVRIPLSLIDRWKLETVFVRWLRNQDMDKITY